MVETEGLSDMEQGDGFKNYFLSRAAVKRLGTPDDIAGAAVFLASEDSSWMSGETLVVSGGARL
jgi:3-oxoacyl-[acyl-carrier protein] reductase